MIAVATGEIYSDGRSRREVQRDIKKKEQAVEQLSRKYASGSLDQEAVRQCIYSISDNHAFLRVNRDPCEKMIMYLKRYFDPHSPKDSKTSLAIRSGKGGARLTHDHAKQYAYVLQSLTLWREILYGASCHLSTSLLSKSISHQNFSTSGRLPKLTFCLRTSRTDYATPGRA